MASDKSFWFPLLVQIVSRKKKEAIESLIILDHDYQSDIDRMMNFFYHGTYDDMDLDRNNDPGYGSVQSARSTTTPSPVSPPSTSSDPSFDPPRDIFTPEHGKLSRILTHVHMYALADKYFIRELKAYAMYEFEMLKSWTPNLTYGPGTIIRAVCSTTPPSDRGLRRKLAYAFASDAWGRFKLPVEIEEDLHAAWDEYPDARVDVLEMMLAKQEEKCRVLQVGRECGVHARIWRARQECEANYHITREQLQKASSRINRLQRELHELKVSYHTRGNELAEERVRRQMAENDVMRLNTVVETLSLNYSAAGNFVHQAIAATVGTGILMPTGGNQSQYGAEWRREIGIRQLQRDWWR